MASGLPFPSPGDLPNPGIKPRSPALQADSLPPEPPGISILKLNKKTFFPYALPYFYLTFSFQTMFSSVQFSSVTQSCPTLCDPMNCSMPDLPVHHHLPEFTQTHVHQVGDAIHPSYPLSSPFPPAPNPSQHQSLFKQCTLCLLWFSTITFKILTISNSMLKN